MSDHDLTKYANAVGIIYDQSLPVRYPLGVVWQVDADTVVTCAHSVVLYSEIAKALKVRFPTSGREFSVRSAIFHPGLDKTALKNMARRGLTDPVNSLPLQKYNLALLNLSSDNLTLDAEEIASINESFQSFLPDSEPGLGGSLAEIELALVLQTITNARKVGTVSIFDERNRALGQIFCSDGRVTHAYYHNLVNEMAIYQIIGHRLAGSFSFKSGEEPDWTTVSEISRPLDMLLIEALRRFDEFEKLSAIVGGPSSLFVRVTEQPNLDVMPPETRETVKLLWPLLDGGTPLGLMWQLVGVDDFAVFMAMQELVKTRQVRYFEAPFVKEREVVPLPLGLDTPLAPNDIVTALWVEDPSLAPLLRSGALLGSVKQLDPSHVLHNIGLPFEASGCPILKDGKVIGIHCGAVPPEPSVVAPDGGFHQMIWVAAILDCLKHAGRDPLDKRRTLVGDESDVALAAEQEGNAGCREVARIQCPKCGRSSLEVANFCKGCGQRLIRDADFKRTHAVKALDKAKVKAAATRTATKLAVIKPETVKRAPNLVALGIGLVLMAVGGGAAGIASMPKPNIVHASAVTVPQARWFSRTLEELTPSGAFVVRADRDKLKGPAKFFIHVKVERDAYIYVLVPQASGKAILLSPTKESSNQVITPGDYLVSLEGLVKPSQSGQLNSILGCNNADDVERFIIVASGKKMNINVLAEKGSEFFETASRLLSCDEDGLGVIVNYADLGANYFDANELKNSKLGVNGLLGDDVFISQLNVVHVFDKSAVPPVGDGGPAASAIPNSGAAASDGAAAAGTATGTATGTGAEAGTGAATGTGTATGTGAEAGTGAATGTATGTGPGAATATGTGAEAGAGTEAGSGAGSGAGAGATGAGAASSGRASGRSTR